MGDTPQQGDALEEAAYELCAVNYPGGVSEDDALAILRRHGLRGPSRLEREVAEIAAAVTPEMLRKAGEAFVEQARQASERIARSTPAPDPERAALLAMLETAADPAHAAGMSPYAVAGMAQRAARALAAPAEREPQVYVASGRQEGKTLAGKRAIAEVLGFDPENHHNAAACPFCNPPAPEQKGGA